MFLSKKNQFTLKKKKSRFLPCHDFLFTFNCTSSSFSMMSDPGPDAAMIVIMYEKEKKKSTVHLVELLVISSG